MKFKQRNNNKSIIDICDHNHIGSLIHFAADGWWFDAARSIYLNANDLVKIADKLKELNSNGVLQVYIKMKHKLTPGRYKKGKLVE